MASPLSWFRRNQKGMLIVFGTLLMAVFGLGSVVDTLLSRRGGSSDASKVAVQFKGGSFTSAQLDIMRMQHFQTVNFLRTLQEQAARNQGDNFRPRAAMIDQIQDLGSPEEFDRQVMDRYLLARKADELGIRVGDEAVMDYLQALADDDSLTFGDLEVLTRQMYGGNIDFLVIKDRLKQELAISHMVQISRLGLPVTPNLTESWKSHKKLNERIECTVLRFPINEFKSQVTATPSDAELKEIFEEGRYRYPDPARGLSGFKTPRKISATLFTAESEDFVQREMQKITPEQVQAEYDRLAAEKNSLVMEFVPQEPEKTDEQTKTDTANPDDPAPKLEDAIKKSDEASEGAESDAKKDDSQSKTGDDKQSEQGQKDNGKKDKSNDKSGKDNDDGHLSLDGSPPFQFVSIVLHSSPQDEPQEKQEEQKDEKGQQQDQQQNESGTDKEKSSTGGNEQSGKSSEDKSQTQNSNEPDKQGKDDAKTIPAGPEKQAAPNDQDRLNIGDLGKMPEQRVKPLDDDLAEQIKRSLAAVPAREAIDEAINSASTDITEYWNEYSMWQQTKDLPVRDREPKPAPVDFDAIAAKHKLTPMSVKLLDFQEFSEHPLGQTSIGITVPGQFGGPSQKRPYPLANYLFEQFYELEEYRPEILSAYLFNNKYIAFIEEKVEPKILEFAEAKPAVEEYWRTQMAQEKARERARQVAAELASQGVTLIDKYPDEADETGGFTWNTVGRNPYPVLPPNGLQTGEEFMETAFGLKVNEVGVAIDGDRKNICVIQKTKDDERDLEAMKEEFFSSLSSNRGIPFGVTQVYLTDVRKVMRDWVEQMEKELDVKWLGN